MFFEFSSNINAVITSSDENKKAILLRVLSNITDSARKKRHYISCENSDISIALCRFCQENGKNTEALLFNHISEKFSMIACVKYELKFYISIGDYQKNISFNGNQIQIDYKSADNEFFFERPFLIPETLLDKQYFDAIAEYVQNITKNPILLNIKYKFRKEHGGGGQTYNVFVERLNEHSPVLVILDSDKKSPSSEIGGTANVFIQDHNIVQYKDYYFIILNVHEMENLYSSEFFLKKAGYPKKSYEKLREFDSVSSNARLFYDIKMGINYKQYLNNPYNQTLYGDFDKNSKCTKDCTSCSVKKCNVNILQGDTHFLENLFKNMNYSNSFNQDINSGYSGLIQPIKDEWYKIFVYMATVGCYYNETITGVN